MYWQVFVYEAYLNKLILNILLNTLLIVPLTQKLINWFSNNFDNLALVLMAQTGSFRWVYRLAKPYFLD
jgi:hypothetical protein